MVNQDTQRQGPSKVYGFQLLNKKPKYLRADVFPLFFTATAMWWNFGSKIFDREELVPVLCLILAITVHSLMFFINFWNADINVLFAFSKLDQTVNIQECSHIWVKIENKKQDTIKKMIVPLLSTSVEISPGNLQTVHSIEIMKKRMLWSNQLRIFQAIPYPIKETIEHYQIAEGLQDKKEEGKANLVWGNNKMNIPIPQFLDLYQEHVVAPFFVFQLFCTLLWLLDEYWYYSLFNLGMLFFFEGTVVMQRLQNMKRLRSMRKPPQEIWVHRASKWEKIMTDDLYPGDIVLLNRISGQKKQNVPCDFILLSGSAVVNEAILTGESQPLVKESIAQKDESEEILQLKGLHRAHILNSGTEILQHIAQDVNEDLPHLAKVPIDDGICCYVLKNGFETKQGKLMRMILFSSERVTVENTEVYYYLLILLCFALMASYHVMMEGLKDPDRSRYKIMLRCVLIITNVVPPELPMELSLAVNYSIITMIKKQIFCTEPFRIPNAGKVNICCFDKTGTLTQNDLIIKGIAAINLNTVTTWGKKSAEQILEQKLIPLGDIYKHSKETLIVLAGCHTIAMADGVLVGDPIEKQAFEGIKFKHDGRRTSEPVDGSNPKVIQIKRFLFESSLKRQSAIVNIQDGTTRGGFNRVLCKGAPEVVEKFLKKVPEGYKENYLEYVKNGARVLVLAYKDLKMQADQASHITREDAEKDLIYAGFIISECPLKEDTKGVIEELVQSAHEVKMITGDNQLTAAYVAHQLNFAPKSQQRSLFVNGVTPGTGQIRWNDIDDQFVKETKTPDEIKALSKQYLLCVSGDQLDKIQQMDNVGKQIRYIHVFSRTSPNQKTAIVARLNNEGNITMMTGDGTNDVGSLKRADVGLAIVNNPAPSKELKKQKKEMSIMPAKELLAGKSMSEQKKVIEDHQKEYQKVMMSMAGDPTLELGDACIAAPFTYKFQSLKSVKRLIREGRKTLTTTFQMYKILSLNSLVSAYTMSALYLDGVKMGDYQATYMGMGISFLFIFLSFTQPLKKLHKERPPASIFHWSLTVSVFGQFLMHLYCLRYLVDLCEPHIDRDKDDSLVPDGEFKPNIKNSVLFVYQWWLQCSVIFVNYTGRPFMQDMNENPKLKYLLMANFMIATCCIFDYSPDIRETLQLVAYPNEEFKMSVVRILFIDLGVCYVLEKICKTMYLKTFETNEDD